MNSEGKIRHLIQGLYTVPCYSNAKSALVASQCSLCNEIYFPKKDVNFCAHCQHEALKDITLSREGQISTFTVVTQQPAGGFYKGPVPYAYGFVDLPEGVRIKTQFKGDFRVLQAGLTVELCIEKLYENKEGEPVYTYMFRPTNVTD